MSVKKAESLWWVDLAWLTGAHQDAFSFPPLHDTGRKYDEKSLWVELRTGKLITLPSYSKQAWLGED